VPSYPPFSTLSQVELRNKTAEFTFILSHRKTKNLELNSSKKSSLMKICFHQFLDEKKKKVQKIKAQKRRALQIG